MIVTAKFELSEADIQRFWSRVIKGEDDECWGWTGKPNSQGYGVLSVNGPARIASRISWVIHFGDIPDGLFVLHECDNPICTNPRHLFLGTHEDNMADRNRKGRCRTAHLLARGEQHPMAKLNEEQVREIRRLYAQGGVTTEQLGKQYNVTGSMIASINRRVSWKHIE